MKKPQTKNKTQQKKRGSKPSPNNELNAIRSAVDKWANYRARAFAFNAQDAEQDRKLGGEIRDAISVFTCNSAPRDSDGMRKRCYNECSYIMRAVDSLAAGDALIRVKILAALWSERSD